MKKLNYIFAAVFSVNVVYAGSCDLAYQKNYLSKEIEYKFSALNYTKINEVLEGLSTAKNSKEKMELIEEVYNFLFQYHHKKVDGFEVVFENLKKKTNFGPEYISNIRRQVEFDGAREIAPFNNKLIDGLAEILKEAGAPVVVKSRAEIADFTFKYLEIDLMGKATSQSVRTLQRYQSRFGVKNVTFDLLENLKNGSAGFSQPSTKRIDLGIRGVRNIVFDDLITMVGKHEFHHAAFANMRAKGVASIYHPQYIATERATITKVKSGYDRYLSAEELYNWTNNSFWAATRMKDISKFHPDDVINDFIGINSYLGGTEKIARQTREASRSFTRLLKSIKKDQIPNNTFRLEILDANLSNALAKEEAINLAFIKPNGVVMTFYIDESIRPLVDKVMGQRVKYIVEYNQRYQKIMNDPEKIKALDLEFAVKESKEIQNELHQILDVVIRDQAILAKVANQVVKESETIIAKSSDLLKEMKLVQKTNPNFHQSDEWKIKFEEMAKEYRKFGNVVKENYKGFAGN